jgi:hypothetical protein
MLCWPEVYELYTIHFTLKMDAAWSSKIFVSHHKTACSYSINYLCVTLYRLPPIQWVPGALSLGVKWPGREADHSFPSRAEVKNAWSYTSTPPIRFHGVVLS